MKTNQIPDFDKKFFCILNRNRPILGAVISSYFCIEGRYTPMFEFSEVTVARQETDIFEMDKHYISKTRADHFNIRVGNALRSMGECEYLILGGLTDIQKSYLDFLDNYNVIEIEDLIDADILLKPISDKNEYLSCSETDIHTGFYDAVINNKILKIDSDAAPIYKKKKNNRNGIIVIEKKEVVSTIIAINYALSVESAIVIIEPPQTDIYEIKNLIERWKENDDKKYFYDLSALLYNRIEYIDFTKYKFATFFTFGAPYSLILNNSIPFTYVNTSLNPDFFIFNNILAEAKKSYHSSVVFSPLEFGQDEETSFIIDEIKKRNYYVRPLVGGNASVFNVDNHVREFPYEILHFCSHGGEVNGFSVIEEFKDRDGNIHVVEYDEVLSFAPDRSEELIKVERKCFWKSFDGLVWKSKELKEKNYPSYVYADMAKKITGKKCRRKKKKSIIENSCSIKCSDFIYQASFNSIAGLHTHPFIFNNTCWSWYDIAESFLHSGARCYIGTLWAINNNIAKKSAETFYETVFKNTILYSLQEAFMDSKGSKDENVYIFWGLHFSTLKVGESIADSRMRVAKGLLISFDRWRNRLKIVQDKNTRMEIKRLINWNFNQLIKYFADEVLTITRKPKR